jgi:predicted nucleotide-binding protein
MQLRKTFHRTRFDTTVIGQAVANVEKLDDEDNAKDKAAHDAEKAVHSFTPRFRSRAFSTSRGNEAWELNTIHEWYAAYERGATAALMSIYNPNYRLSVSVETNQATTVSVTAPTPDVVESIMRHFNVAEPTAKLPVPPVTVTPEAIPVVVFIGHGRSGDWRDIKDHLQDSHHYKIEAYEVGARAGHSIRDVLASMLQSSSFALLVMTGEDETADGDARARQNVVHEAGLFQGRLGFNRAIAVVENGVEVFSNLDGVQQIRYDKGNVKSTFGEILATLRREFGDRR